jgi:hypothetical protein
MGQSLLEKLTGSQLVKKFPAFYGILRFITASTCLYPAPAQSSPYPTSHLLKIHINIILPSTPRSPQWSLSLRFPHQNPVHASSISNPSYMPRSSHFSRFYHPHNGGWRVQVLKLLIEHIAYTATNFTFHIISNRLCVKILRKSWYIKVPRCVPLHTTLLFMTPCSYSNLNTIVGLWAVPLPGSVSNYPWKWRIN